MRSTKKSELVVIVIGSLSMKTDGIFLEVDETVIDGGASLHRVPWRSTSKDPATVSGINKSSMSMVFDNETEPHYGSPVINYSILQHNSEEEDPLIQPCQQTGLL